MVCVCAKSLQLCLILCDPMDYSLLGSSVHRILQARIVELVAMISPGDIPDPGNLPDPGIETASLMSPALAGGFFITGAMLEALDDMGCHLLFTEPKNYGSHIFQTVYKYNVANCFTKDRYKNISYPTCSFAMSPGRSLNKRWSLYFFESK